MDENSEDHRKGKKKRLYLSARRKRSSNIQKWNTRRHRLEAKKTDLMGPTILHPTTVEETDHTTVEETDHHHSVSAISCSRKLCFDDEQLQSKKTEVQAEEIELMEMPEEAIMEEKSKPLEVEGRRIVDFQYFFDSLKELDNHGKQHGCSLSNMRIVKERKQGLISTFSLCCDMCNSTFQIHTENRDKCFDVNHSAVAGIMNIGSGFSHLQTIVSCLDVPPINVKLYNKLHDQLADAWEETALEVMKEAAQQEKEIAIRNGSVDTDGVPLIRVVCDGSWARRSYNKTKFSSLSGVGAIVGYTTRKVLYIGVKNKYCTVCARADKQGKEPSTHVCYKNWTGSSSSMEAAAITEGFLKSEGMYGLKYHEMIADGDSSCYKKIVEARPYKNMTVKKIECRNHLLRNMCNKLRDLSTSTRSAPPALRKLVSANILKCRTAVVKATDFRKRGVDSDATKVNELRKDIINIPSHIFGEHKDCKERNYFCDKQCPDEVNTISELKKYGMYNNMMDIFRYLSFHSKSLLCDVDSNYVEQFNSIICKFIGGKRINYTQRRSYQARCSVALVSANTKKPFYRVFKHLSGCSPGKYAKKVEDQRLKNLRKRKYISSKTRCIPRVQNDKPNQDYGENCQKEDISPEDYALAEQEFLEGMRKTKEEREEIEERTREQADCPEWFEHRRQLLTASNFGVVCRRRPHTNCGNLVKRLLYQVEIKSKATFWGQVKEPVAKEQLETEYNVTTKTCGLIIDPSIAFLGATPDGLIGLDGVLEIKCPYAARSLTPEEAIRKRKITLWKMVGNKLELNKKHKWYYQIQGQLHITRRIYCLFVVWTPYGIKISRIVRDDVFWEQQMEQKLILFYKSCLLPELIDPRVPRNMPVREPQHILEAQRKIRQRSR